MTETEVINQKGFQEGVERSMDDLTKRSAQETEVTLTENICPNSLLMGGREHALQELRDLHHRLFEAASSFGTVVRSCTRMHPNLRQDGWLLTMTFTYILPGDSNLRDTPALKTDEISPDAATVYCTVDPGPFTGE